MDSALLTVKHLSVQFEDRQLASVKAVKDISFTLNAGQTLAIVGESGSGKSVASLAIMGLLAPNARVQAESIRLGSTDLLGLTPKERRSIRGKRIGMIFQEPMSSLHPLICIGDQIIEALSNHRQPRAQAASERMHDLLRDVGLPEPKQIARRYPHQLSGGQLQRAMIAMAISCEPELLIADEPTTALDVTIQRQVIDLILRLQENLKMGLLFITHDLALVADVADSVAVMYRGEILEHRPALELFQDPKQPYTKGLLACRPPLDKRPHRLLTVSDFMNKDEAPVLSSKISVAVERAPKIDQKVILEIKDLSKIYRQKTSLFASSHDFKAIDSINLKVKRGARLGIVGESGSGKTTLARCMIRLLEPSHGQIIFEGQDLSRLSQNALTPIRRRLQYIFQNPYASLNPRLSIAEILIEALVIHKIGGNRQERLEKAALRLTQVGLNPDMLHRYPHEFSGGQRQRICIARVLMLDPELIICDECVSALDVSIQAQILNLLLDVQEKSGITFIFISHDLSVVKYFAEDVCVMSQGQIVEQGPADEIYAHPQHAFTQRLLKAIPKGVPKGSLTPLSTFY